MGHLGVAMSLVNSAVLLVFVLLTTGYLMIFLRRKMAENLRSPGSGVLGNIAIQMMTKVNRKTSEDAAQRLNIQSGETVVELGPGFGWGLRASLAFSPERLVGVEISQTFRNALSASDIAQSIELRSDDARDLSAFLEKGSVDKILAVNVIYFLTPLAEYAREIKRILDSDGIALLACKFDLVRNADTSVFANIEPEKIKEVFNTQGLSVREEQVDLGNPKVSYLALWVTHQK